MNAIKQSVAGWCVTGLLCGLLCLTPSLVLAAPTTQAFTSPVTIQGAITIEKIFDIDFGIIEVADNTRNFEIRPDGTLGDPGGGGFFAGGQQAGEFIISSPFTDPVALTWSPPVIRDSTGVPCTAVGGIGPAPLMRNLKLVDTGNDRFDRDQGQSVNPPVTVFMGARLRVNPGTRGDWECNFSLSADFE